ncbi:MAG: hypothetical protein ACXVRV_08915 [Gaiellaceae bacterium]
MDAAPRGARRPAAGPVHRRERDADLPDRGVRVRGHGVGVGVLHPASFEVLEAPAPRPSLELLDSDHLVGNIIVGTAIVVGTLVAIATWQRWNPF